MKNLPKSLFTYGLVILLLVAAFFIGKLSTEVKQLKKDALNQDSPTVNLPSDGPTQPSAPKPAKEVDPVTEDDWVKGDRTAKIALIEYSDTECPYCKRFHRTAQQVVDNYEGQVMWVYRHFPLDQLHAQARKEAEATECAGKLAGNEGFWKLLDEIYEVTTSNDGFDLDTLPGLAAGFGINSAEFSACLDSGEMADEVEADYQSGLKAGVTGTPGNVLLNIETGETQLVPGALPYSQLSQAIDSMLE